MKMKTRKVVKIIKGIAVTICILPIMLIICLMIAVTAVNNNIARNELNRIKKFPLPRNTECVETISRAGKLSGSGNGMQYVGIMLIKSDMNAGELEKYYGSLSDDDHEVGVFYQTTKEIARWEHACLKLDTDVDSEGYFIVYSWTDTYSFNANKAAFCDFDLRGH